MAHTALLVRPDSFGAILFALATNVFLILLKRHKALLGWAHCALGFNLRPVEPAQSLALVINLNPALANPVKANAIVLAEFGTPWNVWERGTPAKKQDQ
jgi:hypothetical protein